MGKYITTTTIYNDRLSRISTTVVAASLLSLYIDRAEAEVDSYLAKRYNIASLAADPPQLLKDLAADMATYYVLIETYTRDNESINEWLELKKDNAVSLLEKLANDELRFVISNTAISPNDDLGIQTNMEDTPLIANVDDPYNWKVPQNLTDNIESDRDTAG